MGKNAKRRKEAKLAAAAIGRTPRPDSGPDLLAHAVLTGGPLPPSWRQVTRPDMLSAVLQAQMVEMLNGYPIDNPEVYTDGKTLRVFGPTEWDDGHGFGRENTFLRDRCNTLITPPPSDVEWLDADLLHMDGLDASDEELVAYWALHRHELEIGDDMGVDLAMAIRVVASGLDPVVWYDTVYLADFDD